MITINELHLDYILQIKVYADREFHLLYLLVSTHVVIDQLYN